MNYILVSVCGPQPCKNNICSPNPGDVFSPSQAPHQCQLFKSRTHELLMSSLFETVHLEGHFPDNEFNHFFKEIIEPTYLAFSKDHMFKRLGLSEADIFSSSDRT